LLSFSFDPDFIGIAEPTFWKSEWLGAPTRSLLVGCWWTFTKKFEPFLKINYALRQLLARPASPSSLRRYSLPAGRQGVLRGAFTLSSPIHSL